MTLRPPLATLLSFVLLTLAFALGTYVFTWSAVPIIAVIYGWMARERRCTGTTTAIAAAVAWACLLELAVLRGARIATLTRELAGVMGTSEMGLLLVTLLFPAILAGCAATLVSTLGREAPLS